MENVTLDTYHAALHNQVAELILKIQREEFGVPITLEQQPDLNSIERFYQTGNGNFWVARHGEKVIGTIALIDIGNQQIALRKMFVDIPYRGGKFKTGQKLLDKALAWMQEKKCTEIFLGTLDIFHAAQKFYRRNGFIEVSKEALPPTFPPMKLDNTFFKRSISAEKAIEIVSYTSSHQPWFEKLNREWIEKYFWMEPVDFDVLQHPEEHIIKHGGAILMALLDHQVAGTVALKYVETDVYEFTKMAVDEKFRGKKVGLALAEAAVIAARSLGAKKIILYSNTVLEPAIALYRKIGFEEIPVDGPYKRSNIKMQFVL
jgi:N-acetylglutamate synthase-like GNAT family acetyltransferase